MNFVRFSSNVFFEELVLSNLIASPLIIIFNAWWMTRGEVCVLEGLGRLVVSDYVQDGVLCESFSFEHCGVEESGFVL